MTTLSIQSTSKGHALILGDLVLCVVADPEAAPLDPETLYPKLEGTPYHIHKGNVPPGTPSGVIRIPRKDDDRVSWLDDIAYRMGMPRPLYPGDKVVLTEDLDDELKRGTQGVVSAVRGNEVRALFKVGRLHFEVSVNACVAHEIMKHAPSDED